MSGSINPHVFTTYIREAIPKQDGIDTDLFSGGQILNYEFRDMLKDGKIKALAGAIDKFTETGVVLTDGTELPADLVIYGTGFAKNYDIFDKVIQEKLAIQKDAGCWFKVALLSFAVPKHGKVTG